MAIEESNVDAGTLLLGLLVQLKLCYDWSKRVK
jgi:hypothetical protein